MEKIELNFLGTGNAVPTKKRNHTGIFLRYKNEGILIDCGEGIQRQFRHAEISPSKITRILITHWHGDHFLGLPGLLQTLGMDEYSKTLEIYGPRGTKKNVNLILELVKPKIKISVEEVSGTFVETDDFEIDAGRMFHGLPTNAYFFKTKDKLRLDKSKIRNLGLPNSPILKKLQEGKDIDYNGKKIKSKDVTYSEKGKKISFVLDTGFNEEIIEFVKDSDLLVIESTFSDDEVEQAEEYKHLTARQAGEIAKKSKSRKLILTHISQRYEHNLKKIKDEAEKNFPDVKIVKDLDSLKI